MEDIIKHIMTLYEQDKIDEAIEELHNVLNYNNKNSDLLFLMGKLQWKKGNRQDAIGYYIESDMLNPDGPAKRALEMSADIENYFNPDLLNP